MQAVLNHYWGKFEDFLAAFLGAFISSALCSEFIKILFAAFVSLAGKELVVYFKNRNKNKSESDN